MTLTLTQLRTPVSEEEALQDELDTLEALAFDVTSWQEGSKQRTLLEGMAKCYSQASRRFNALSYSMFSEDAEGLALTKLSLSHYQNTRIAAVSTVGVIRLTGGASGPPYTVTGTEVVVSDGTRTYRSTGYYYSAGTRTAGPYTIPASSYVDAEFSAEVAGTDSNVSNSTITTLTTTYAGVTCNNPVFLGSTWITTSGVDEETDAALRLRNSAKWGTLSGIEGTDTRFEYIARTAVANCRVSVDSANPRGAGTTNIWLALESSIATGADVTLVQAAIDAAAFGSGYVVYASPATVVTVTGTIYYTGTLAVVQGTVEAALEEYINEADIGGFTIGAVTHVLPYDDILTAIRDAVGVRAVTLTAPTTNVAIPTYNAATYTFSTAHFTWTAA